MAEKRKTMGAQVRGAVTSDSALAERIRPLLLNSIGPIPAAPPTGNNEITYLQMDGGNATSMYSENTFRFDMGAAT